MTALTRACALPCHKKAQYRTEADARAAYSFFQPDEYTVLPCPHCRKWHVWLAS
jgi:hypothetical protein